MMVTMWQLFLLNVIFNMSFPLIVGIVVSIFIIVIGTLGKFSEDDFCKYVAKFVKPATITFVICIFLITIIPSKREALAIYIIPKIINNQQVHELPINALNYLNVFFKKELEELEELKKTTKPTGKQTPYGYEDH